MRSQFEAGLRTARALDPGLRLCMTRKMRALRDDAFKALAYADDKVEQSRLAAIARRCAAQSAAAARAAI